MHHKPFQYPFIILLRPVFIHFSSLDIIFCLLGIIQTSIFYKGKFPFCMKWKPSRKSRSLFPKYLSWRSNNCWCWSRLPQSTYLLSKEREMQHSAPSFFFTKFVFGGKYDDLAGVIFFISPADSVVQVPIISDLITWPLQEPLTRLWPHSTTWGWMDIQSPFSFPCPLWGSFKFAWLTSMDALRFRGYQGAFPWSHVLPIAFGLESSTLSILTIAVMVLCPLTDEFCKQPSSCHIHSCIYRISQFLE